MLVNEALEIVNKILEPKSLNYIEELVFLQSWSGKVYREIAFESGYDLSYIKEIGARVWSSLSEALGERVTKKNVQLVLAGIRDVAGVENRVGLPPAPSDANLLKFPTGLVSPYSELYVERPPIEDRVYTEISKPGSLIRIKAPRQMGKTSLVYKTLAHANRLGMYTAMLNLQQVDSELFTDLNRFLRWLCLNVSRQLNLNPKLDDYWSEEIGSKVSCTTYVQEYILKQIHSPLVLAFDEVNQIFEYPALAQDFLPLLRTWHEETTVMDVWQKLRLIVVHSTEVYVPLNVSQSPFNVGFPIQLPEFTRSQVQELADRYELGQEDVNESDLDALMTLVGGHPYLTRLAFYWLRQRQEPLGQLLKVASTQAGIYSDHLRRHWSVLQHYPDLLAAYQQTIVASGGVQLDAITAYRLESMGLVKLVGNMATPGCELYQLYFSAQFAVNTTPRTISSPEASEEPDSTHHTSQRWSHVDELTHVANRRYFDDYLYDQWQQWNRDSPLSLILIDIDFFRDYNDTYGYAAGDACLQRIAGVIREVVKRPADLMARYGGEEFAVLLPMTSANGAIQVAETLRAKVKTLGIANNDSEIGDPPVVTVSLGVASLIPTDHNSPKMLLATADQALYQSKLEGRDRVTFRFCSPGS